MTIISRLHVRHLDGQHRTQASNTCDLHFGEQPAPAGIMVWNHRISWHSYKRYNTIRVCGWKGWHLAWFAIRLLVGCHSLLPGYTNPAADGSNMNCFFNISGNLNSFTQTTAPRSNKFMYLNMPIHNTGNYLCATNQLH